MSVRVAGRALTGPMAWRSTTESSSAAAWRSQRPILDLETCTGCLICWKFCPEPAIVRHEGKVRIELGLCKGCGVCAHECPVDAIEMKDEEL